MNDLTINEWRNICHANCNQHKARVAILISKKIDFWKKIVTKNQVKHFIIIKASIHQGNATIINIYVPNNRAPKYIKQKLTKF